MDTGFAQGKVIVESEYRLPFQEYAYLQPEAELAYMDEEGCITVQCGGQVPHTDRAQIAHSLGLPEEQVRVIYPAISVLGDPFASDHWIEDCSAATENLLLAATALNLGSV